MQLKMVTAAVLLALTVQPVVASDPVDNQVKAAIYDIGRAESQISGLTNRQAPKARRISSMIESAQAQLDASSNQQDSSWLDASKRLQALSARLDTVMQPEASATTANTPSKTEAQPEAPAPATNMPSEVDMGILATIERQLDGFARQMQEFSQSDYTRLRPQLEARINQFKSQYGQLQNQAHPVAIAVAQKVIGIEQHIQGQITTLAAQETALGDVAAKVEDIRKRANPSNQSWQERQVPDAPFTREIIRNFAQKLAATRDAANRDLHYLRSVEGKTSQVAPSTMQDTIATVTSQLDGVERDADLLTSRIEGKLAGHDQIDTYLNNVPVYRVGQQVDSLQQGISLLAIVNEFNEILGRDIVDTTARRARYTGAINQLMAKAASAVDEARFPKIRSADPELLAAAQEVLSREEYDVNTIARMGITYDIQRKHVTEGDVDWGAVSTTVTVTGYEWDEYAVTTVEEVNGQYFLFNNLFKFFHQGGTDVPTGKWTLGERRQGIQILQENINS